MDMASAIMAQRRHRTLYVIMLCACRWCTIGMQFYIPFLRNPSPQKISLSVYMSAIVATPNFNFGMYLKRTYIITIIIGLLLLSSYTRYTKITFPNCHENGISPLPRVSIVYVCQTFFFVCSSVDTQNPTFPSSSHYNVAIIYPKTVKCDRV